MQADIRGKETRESRELSILNPKVKIHIKKKKKFENTAEQEGQETSSALIQHFTWFSINPPAQATMFIIFQLYIIQSTKLMKGQKNKMNKNKTGYLVFLKVKINFSEYKLRT